MKQQTARSRTTSIDCHLKSLLGDLSHDQKQYFARNTLTSVLYQSKPETEFQNNQECFDSSFCLHFFLCCQNEDCMKQSIDYRCNCFSGYFTLTITTEFKTSRKTSKEFSRMFFLGALQIRVSSRLTSRYGFGWKQRK